MKNKLKHIGDFFIHESIRSNKASYEKIFMFVGTILVVAFISTCYLIFYLSKSFVLDLNILNTSVPLLIDALALYIIRNKGRVDIAYTLMYFMGLYSVNITIFLSGGIQSYDTLWYLVLCMCSFLFLGVRIGVISFITSVLSILLFFLAEYFGVYINDYDPISQTAEYKFFNAFFSLVIVTLLLYNFVKSNYNLSQALQSIQVQQTKENIAQDFHDQIGNQLASIKHITELSLQTHETQKQEQLLKTIQTLSNDVYSNFKDFIWNINTESDHADEIFVYIRDFMDSYFAFSETNIYVNVSPKVLPNIQLPKNAGNEIILLFKEAMTNIKKHAKAQNIYFSFVVEGNNLTIKLRDDGIGFNVAKFYDGNGLKNIQKRAQRTGGKLQIKSSELNKGTEIEYSLIL
jgi:signal transduction histidine kinase